MSCYVVRVVTVPDILPIITNVTASLPVQAEYYGVWIYLLIFLIILVASSFVVTPFPGNSLLFVSGALAASHELRLSWLCIVAITAAYIGYDINYWSGRLLGVAACKRGCPRIFEEMNIRKSFELVKKYGALSIIISRFLPMVNLPPFFAGMEPMRYRKYLGLNLAGAILWAGLLLGFGYLLGQIPQVQVIIPFVFDIVILVMAIAVVIALVMVWRAYHTPHKPGVV